MIKINPTTIFVSVFFLIILFFSSQTRSTPTDSITPDPTDNWPTYTSNYLDLVFKYPPDWDLPKEGLIQNSPEIDFDSKLNISVDSALTFEEFIKKNLPTDQTPPLDYLNGNIVGKKLIYRSGADLAIVDIVIAFPGRKQNIITVSYTDFPGHITKSETIDQMLATLRFLD